MANAGSDLQSEPKCLVQSTRLNQQIRSCRVGIAHQVIECFIFVPSPPTGRAGCLSGRNLSCWRILEKEIERVSKYWP